MIRIVLILTCCVFFGCSNKQLLNKKKMLKTNILSKSKMFSFDSIIVVINSNGYLIINTSDYNESEQLNYTELIGVLEPVRVNDFIILHSLEKIICYSISRNKIIWEKKVAANITKTPFFYDNQARFLVIDTGQATLLEVDIKTGNNKYTGILQLGDNYIVPFVQLTNDGILISSFNDESLSFFEYGDLDTPLWKIKIHKRELQNLIIHVVNDRVVYISKNTFNAINLKDGSLCDSLVYSNIINETIINNETLIAVHDNGIVILPYNSLKAHFDFTLKNLTGIQIYSEDLCFLTDDLYKGYLLDISQQKILNTIELNINGAISNIIKQNSSFLYINLKGELISINTSQFEN